MGGIVGGLFGKTPKQQPSQNVQGFSALPYDIQDQYRDLLTRATDFSQNTAAFTPIDLTSGELTAQQLINQGLDPTSIQQGVSSFLNPYRDIITQDINRQFEAPAAALSGQATEAGAFGGSRYRRGQYDLERARTDALSSATANQYNNAMNQFLGQRQQGIGNLLGFGGLERSLQQQQAQAPAQAINFASGTFAPLLGAGRSTGEHTQAGTPGLLGTLGGIGQAASGIGSLFSLFSDRRLKDNINKIGEKHGLNVYEYTYKWSPQRFIGYMADEVEELFPHAIGQFMGYKTVNYGVIHG